MKLLSSGEDRQLVGEVLGAMFGKPWQEFLPSLGLVPGRGEGVDGQNREGILEEVMLTNCRMSWSWIRERFSM